MLTNHGEAGHWKNLTNSMQAHILQGNNSKYLYFPDQPETIISKGKFSVVYIAAEVKTKEKVICKQLSPSLFGNEVAKLRFFIESSINLKHPGIVKTLDLIVEENAVFLIQEFVYGYTLKELIQNRKYFDYRYNKFFYKIIIKCLDALSYIHSNDICHCDIKPANIILEDPEYDINTDDPVIKIIDFGNVKKSYEADDLDKVNKTYNVMYGSPEQIFGFPELIGEHTDIFSTGLVLYETIAKEPALKTVNPLLLRRLQSVVKIEKHFRFDDDLYYIISKATTKPNLPKSESYYSTYDLKFEIIKSLSLRYQTAEDFKNDLDKLLN
ncbi:MAG: serine/threonine protein kinase [Bacteroidales bacterium]|jgi:serine/threonine-protein kinase|nr:serine/threonine protein kinase [Bacteroidales bacterium]